MPLRAAAAAHERIESRQAFGKIVLVPGDEGDGDQRVAGSSGLVQP